jgi:hypothetical protein
LKSNIAGVKAALEVAEENISHFDNMVMFCNDMDDVFSDE